MSYAPLRANLSGGGKQAATTFMAPAGENLKQLPQLLGADYAQAIINYFVLAGGQLEKRRGLKKLLETIGDNPVIHFNDWTSDLFVFGYANSTAIYQLSTDTATVVKSNWSSNPVAGDSNGSGYYFACDGIDRLHRITRTLDYDGQTGNFTVGDIVTGGTSGATAKILEDSDGGVSGTLTLGDVVGTFEDNEALTDGDTGVAVANGTIGFTVTEHTAANTPRAKVLAVIGTRLWAGNLRDDESAVVYSQIDDGTNPPFNGIWTVDTGATDAGRVQFRRAGAVNSIVPFEAGERLITVILSQRGKWATYPDTIDSGGVLTKVDRFVMSRIDLGGARGAISTPKGIFYLNSAGLWRLTNLAQSNNGPSVEDDPATLLWGEEFFRNFTLTNADIVFDARVNRVIFTAAQDSLVNNFVGAIDFGRGKKERPLTRIQGWSVNRLMISDSVIYAASSVGTILYEAFAHGVYDDDGQPIGTTYIQELRTGDLETRQVLDTMYCQGFLSSNQVINIAFDVWNRNGELTENFKQFNWTAQYEPGVGYGYGQAAYGQDAYGGDQDFSNLIEAFDGIKPFIRNYQRVRLRITSSDKMPHIINWIKLESKVRKQIRRRKLSLVT